MKFRDYLAQGNDVNESKNVMFKAPKGFFEDESMMDDFGNEMEEQGLSWDVDYSVSDDGTEITFFNKVSNDVMDILKSLKFKK